MELPKRKSTRIRGYDYATNGAYFVTLCTQGRRTILSRVVGEGFPLPQLLPTGTIVETWIGALPEKYPTVSVDHYVIMPNHVHLLLTIDPGDGRGNPSPTLTQVIGWLKYQTTKDCNRRMHTEGNRLFQRSFYDHVVRGEQDYQDIWTYIENNPLQWELDRFYTK
ncbi:MAG: transposase [Acutalibacteraceae bacterium]|jgi:putative transposase